MSWLKSLHVLCRGFKKTYMTVLKKCFGLDPDPYGILIQQQAGSETLKFMLYVRPVGFVEKHSYLFFIRLQIVSHPEVPYTLAKLKER